MYWKHVMNTSYKHIKIKIEHPALTVEDLQDRQRWENEGGHLAEKPDFIELLALPISLHKDWIFEVKGGEIIVEDGQLYLEVEINVLSHH